MLQSKRPNFSGEIDLFVLIQRLVRNVSGLSTKAASRQVSEYLRFLELKASHEDWHASKLSPSPLIDRVWHLHVLDTANYEDNCVRACGYNIHHNPDGPFDSDRGERYRRTLVAYKTTFGVEAPIDIWPADEVIMVPNYVENLLIYGHRDRLPVPLHQLTLLRLD